MKLLILCDHTDHRISNSIYPIAQALLRRAEIHEIAVCSRGRAENRSFFEQFEGPEIAAIKIDEKFSYPSASFFLSELQTMNITDFDFILLRLPRPIKNGFFEFLISFYHEMFCIFSRLPGKKACLSILATPCCWTAF